MLKYTSFPRNNSFMIAYTCQELNKSPKQILNFSFLIIRMVKIKTVEISWLLVASVSRAPKAMDPAIPVKQLSGGFY